MTAADAIRECEFWTTNVPGTLAIGSTRKPAVGMFFDRYARDIEAEGATNPLGPRVWGISIPGTHKAFPLILEEIEKRKGGTA